ncbi:MAG: hypothetical protein LBL86_11855 [Coriobacteriales bacterium]|jgi:hypothetical protein|nr:hypothetical protein [Coriobacteriales bacterium]
MTEMVLSKSTLQETLLPLIPTERVRLREDGGVISLTPVREGKGSGLLGIGAGSKLTTERFFGYRREDMEIEHRAHGK